MNCRHVTRNVSAYLDGELTGVEMLEIRRHIMDCADCHAEFETIRMTKALVSRLSTAEPRDGFVAMLSVRLDEIQIPAYQRAWNHAVRTLRERVNPVRTAFVAVSVALIVLSARSIDQITVIQPDVMAQVPTVNIHPIDSLRPEILTMSTEPVYTAPIPIRPMNASFVSASFGP